MPMTPEQIETVFEENKKLNLLIDIVLDHYREGKVIDGKWVNDELSEGEDSDEDSDDA